MGKKRFLPTFFGQLPTFKIKNGQQFLPNLLGFLGVVAKNPLFSLINCEEKIYIFIKIVNIKIKKLKNYTQYPQASVDNCV